MEWYSRLIIPLHSESPVADDLEPERIMVGCRAVSGTGRDYTPHYRITVKIGISHRRLLSVS